MELILVLLTIVVIGIIAKCIMNKYNGVFVFVSAGIVILLIITFIKGSSILPITKTTGNIYLDVFEFVRLKIISDISKFGMVLMVVTGYAVYMSYIGASSKLALKATEPLKKINAPYVVLSIIFVLGCILKLVITSHSGISILMVATALPILLNLGISRASGAAVMCFTGCLDWGPNDSSAIFAAELNNMSIMEYFLNYQGKVSLIILLILVLFIPFYYSRLDKKNEKKNQKIKRIEKLEDNDCPNSYIFLPALPLFLVAFFSFVPSVSMSVVTANLLSFAATFILEFFRYKNLKETGLGMEIILKAMGECFANTVSIVISAGIFAESIKCIGGIKVVANFFASLNGGVLITMILMSCLMFGAVILLGSGYASWYAFGPLVPNMTKQMGVSALYIALPMQLATSLGRSLSPVSGVVIAITGLTGVRIEELIRYSIIPMLIGLVTNIVASYIILNIILY